MSQDLLGVSNFDLGWRWASAKKKKELSYLSDHTNIFVFWSYVRVVAVHDMF